jgi:hypothetical protein
MDFFFSCVIRRMYLEISVRKAIAADDYTSAGFEVKKT